VRGCNPDADKCVIVGRGGRLTDVAALDLWKHGLKLNLGAL